MIERVNGSRLLPLVAAFGASLSTLVVYTGVRPKPLLDSFHATGVSSVFVLSAFFVCGLWALRHASGSAWRWAGVIGAMLAVVHLTILGSFGSGLPQLRRPGNAGWVIIQWLGTGWMIACTVAALVAVVALIRTGRLVAPRPRSVPAAALAGAFVATLAVYLDARPGPLPAALSGSPTSAVFVFLAFACCGFWVLRRASRSAWTWAAGIGALLATAQLIGLPLRRSELHQLVQPESAGWAIIQWLGTGWMATCGLAALIAALDTQADGSRIVGPVDRGIIGRLIGSLRGADASARRRGQLAVMGILVLSRLPYLLMLWPGTVQFDTFRSYAYARGTFAWESYEPVGYSLFITPIQWLGTHLGWGDAGGVAIGAITLILASSAAITFTLARMAVWGVPRGVWAAALAWLALLPVFGYFSVELIKDMPFTIAMLVFLTCIGEVSLGRDHAARRWPWITMAVAAVIAFGMRNNGIHVVLLTLPLLLIPLRRWWKRILVVLSAVVVAFMLYVGPLYALLDVRPGPAVETYSIPLQQLGRIAKLHAGSLSSTDRAFYERVFSGDSPEELATHYVPGLADPMKLRARSAWHTRSIGEFLSGWSRIVAEYPVTAVVATLANTVGYWDPEGASYDGLTRWSANDIRRIHLDIPSGKPTTGMAGAIERSGIMPTLKYAEGLQDDGYLVVPVLGLAMSPGPVCWMWLICGLLVVRSRDRTALAVFIPAAVLVLTFLAGPVSGGQRYSLTLFMALPLAAAALAVATRPPAARLPDANRGAGLPDTGRPDTVSSPPDTPLVGPPPRARVPSLAD